MFELKLQCRSLNSENRSSILQLANSKIEQIAEELRDCAAPDQIRSAADRDHA